MGCGQGARRRGNERIIKKVTRARDSHAADDLRSEYRFDYGKAKPNRFAASYRAGSRVMVLDPDVAQAFTSAEVVNTVLRTLLETMPQWP